MKKIITILAFFFAAAGLQAQISWNMAMDVASSGFGNLHPRIVTNASGDPLILWNYNMNAMFSKWNGSAFTTPVALNPAPVSVAGASWMGPDIAAKGDTVFVVFKVMPEADTSSHIFITRSIDGGITFSAPTQVDNIGDSISRFPTVSIDDSGNPVVAFMKFDNSFMDSRWVVTRSNDFGNTFINDTKVSGFNGSTAVCDCCPGSLASAGNMVTMLYRDNNNNIRDMFAGVSTDNGNSFSSDMPVDQNNFLISICTSSGPDGVIAGDSLYTVYMSGANGYTRVYLSVSSLQTLSGGTGSEIISAFPGLGIQNYPRIASDGSAMGIVWKQTVNGTDEAALLFTADYTSGFPGVYDTVDLGDVTNADIAMSNGNIFIVWEDDASGTIKFRSGTYNIFTGIDHEFTNRISVTPSLTTDFISVSGTNANSRVSISDVTGRTVFSKSYNEKSFRLSLEQLPEGIYFLSIENEQQKFFTTKIIKY